MTATGMYHDEALDLVSASLDWVLEPDEQAELDHHLAGCVSCRFEAEMILADDDRFDLFDWEDPLTQQSADWEADMNWGDSNRSDSDGDDKVGVPVWERERAPRPGDVDFDEEAVRPLTREDDDEDDTNIGHGRTEGDADDDTDATPADDPSAPLGGAMGDSEDADDDGDDVTDGSSAGDVEVDEALEELNARIAAEAEREAAAMSDDELADQDDEGPDVGAADCMADGVSRASQDRSLSAKDAEDVVRTAQDVQDAGDGSKIDVCLSARQIARDRGSNSRPESSMAAAALIRNALLRSRTGHTGIEAHQARGRLDSKGLHRIAYHDSKLFRRMHAPDPGRFLVWVMVDCSASMSGREIGDAASVARTMAQATGGTPNVRMAVWGWSDPFRTRAKRMASAGVIKVWETGQDTASVDDLTRLPMGGTPDSPVLSWAWRSILKQLNPGERAVIIMASDGQGYGNLGKVVADATKHGVIVRSVALGAYVNAAHQEKTYGPRGYVPWAGSIVETARPLGALMGRIAAGLEGTKR